MTDTAPPAPETPAPEETPSEPAPRTFSPEIQAEIDAIRAQTAARAAAELQAAQAEEARLAKLEAAKKICDDICLEINEAVQLATDPQEKTLLIQLAVRKHEPHRVMLENAYLESNGQRAGDSNPAQPGVITPLESHVSVLGDTSAEVDSVPTE
jgi:hypothetical protein